MARKKFDLGHHLWPLCYHNHYSTLRLDFSEKKETNPKLQYSNLPIYFAVGSKNTPRKSFFISLILQSSMFLTWNFKKLYEFTVIPRYKSQLVGTNLSIYFAIDSKKTTRKSFFILLVLQSSMFLTWNVKKLYEFTVIPRYKSQFNINWMMSQIEVGRNQAFNDVNRYNL